PREVVSQGDDVSVLILEVDAERRRLSLSLKRVDGGPEAPSSDDGTQLAPNLDLSEDVFTDEAAAAPAELEGEPAEPEALVEIPVEDGTGIPPAAPGPDADEVPLGTGEAYVDESVSDEA